MQHRVELRSNQSRQDANVKTVKQSVERGVNQSEADGNSATHDQETSPIAVAAVLPQPSNAVGGTGANCLITRFLAPARVVFVLLSSLVMALVLSSAERAMTPSSAVLPALTLSSATANAPCMSAKNRGGVSSASFSKSKESGKSEENFRGGGTGTLLLSVPLRCPVVVVSVKRVFGGTATVRTPPTATLMLGSCTKWCVSLVTHTCIVVMLAANAVKVACAR